MTGATDIHVHVQKWEEMRPAVRDFLRGAGEGALERAIAFAGDPGLLLAEMDRCGIRRVGLVNDVSPEVTGFTEATNRFAADYAARDSSRLLPIGGVHARRLRDPAGAVRDLAAMGMVAIKIHPPHHGYPANAYTEGLDALAAVYRTAEDLGLPVMIHTGTSVIPGARCKYGRPMELDDVAVDFPDLPILMAHGGRPLWTEEAFFVLRRHRNVRLDLSGIPPRRIPEWFPRLPELGERVLWGSDWPGPGATDLGAALDAFRGLPFPEEWKRGVTDTHSSALFPEREGGE
ncbi:MAG: amidohydrolase [Candidatus Eisenbacteria bacterium]|nr:amidohydrolase [Candidatus Eisenbacteria bacterium]